jgi:hypothetical protein
MISGRLQLADGGGSYRFTADGLAIYTAHSFPPDDGLRRFLNGRTNA